MTTSEPPQPEAMTLEKLAERQLAFGWRALLVYLSLGIILEGLHAFKAGIYLDVSNETRRLMWTLAHAHGTLLAMINLAYALALKSFPPLDDRWPVTAGKSLRVASVLIPAGFFLGGVTIYSGDPGLGIVLVPVGAVFLLMAVYLAGSGFSGKRRSP